jgi:hypothetical protein
VPVRQVGVHQGLVRKEHGLEAREDPSVLVHTVQDAVDDVEVKGHVAVDTASHLPRTGRKGGYKWKCSFIGPLKRY